MLLLFLSIFFQYDLLHCRETVNGKDEFMDYSITAFWWNSPPGIAHTDRTTPQYSFLPTPIGWILNADNTLEPTEAQSPEEEYMIVFLIELTRLTAAKENETVHDVVKHTYKIINNFYRSGQLLWLGTPLINVTRNVARFLKESDIDAIQNRSASLHHMLNQRHQELSVEVNTILEDADMLYNDVDGRLLLDSLKEFAAYPNISLTGYWVCNNIIINFLRPYRRRVKGSRQRQKLLDSVNLLLKTRLYNDSSPDETKVSSQKELVTQKDPHCNNTRSPRKRKRRSHRKRERKSFIDTDLT